jgi:hypothetical protein
MSAKPLADISAEIITLAKAARPKRRAASPKPPPVVLTNGRHFSRCPAAAVFDQNLTDGEVRGLAAAGAFTDKTGICRASQSTIARRLAVRRLTVHRWFTSLVAKGYLRLVRKTKRANGSDGPNVYQLVYPPLLETDSERGRDAQLDGARYPTSGETDFCAGGVPSAISPGASARMTN